MSIICPRDGVYMSRERKGNVTVDYCESNGCYYYGPGELQRYLDFVATDAGVRSQRVRLHARTGGHSSGHDDDFFGQISRLMGGREAHGIECPEHHETMGKTDRDETGVVLDVDRYGCVFFDDEEELDKFTWAHLEYCGYRGQRRHYAGKSSHGARSRSPMDRVFGGFGRSHERDSNSSDHRRRNYPGHRPEYAIVHHGGSPEHGYHHGGESISSDHEEGILEEYFEEDEGEGGYAEEGEYVESDYED